MNKRRVLTSLLLLVSLVWITAAPAMAQAGDGQFHLFLPLTNKPPSEVQIQPAAVPPLVLDKLPASHIVVFHDDVEPGAAASELARGYGLTREFVYRHALKGASFRIPPAQVDAVRNDPRVASVEPNQIVHTFVQEVPTGVRRIYAYENLKIDIDGIDDFRVDVDVAVIDTGIDLQHPDLNVVASTDCSGGSPFKGNCKDGGGDDDQYHGTHVAGTIGALDNGYGVVGVAPGARLWAVKVLNSAGSGYMSWIVAGIDYVTAHADQIEVANMSLGCECTSSALNDAITNSVAAGVTYVVAAGNEGKDAATFSPANHPKVITVSAMADFDGEPPSPDGPAPSTCRNDVDDTLADFSNYGSLVEIAAPGVCILSTFPLERGEYGTISGTSMASPHVAGAAALLAASGVTGPSDILTALQTSGIKGWTIDPNDVADEPLLKVRNESVFNPVLDPVAAGPVDNPPDVYITSPTGGETVSGTVGVSAYASDDDTVISVEFFVDGESIGDGTQAGDGWSVDWNTTGYTNDAHILSAVATDSAFHSTTSGGVEVDVDNGTTATPGDITLWVTAYKEKGIQMAELTWVGATSGNVDIFRDGERITLVSNSGAYVDNLNARGGGSYDYKVCEAGTSTCSETATAVY